MLTCAFLDGDDLIERDVAVGVDILTCLRFTVEGSGFRVEGLGFGLRAEG